MKKLPLLNALLSYHDEENLILSMPGNKSGKAFLKDQIGREFCERLGKLDITEVEPLDNLHHPDGIIKEAQELLKNYYGVNKAFFVVNGSSGGNLASIFAAFNEGDQVLVERNCHRSIYNALILRKLKITYIQTSVLANGIFLPPSKEEIYKAINKCESPRGIILTYPNYFGITYNLEEVLIDLKSKGLKILIDQAHGAHFQATKELPKSMAKVADYTVMSAHKTLPALTGGSFLLVNDENSNIEFYVSAFMTTSPSYLIMASLDYARYYIEKYGTEDYNGLISMAEESKKRINSLDKVKVLSKQDLPQEYEIDKSRYVLVLPSGYSGHKLLDYLRIEKIQCEMSTDSSVVLILSPVYGRRQFDVLYRALEKLKLKNIKSDIVKCESINVSPIKALEPYEVFSLDGEECELENSDGRILKEAIVPYPPGIPLISSGEIITKDLIEKIEDMINRGITILGIKDCKINVLK